MTEPGAGVAGSLARIRELSERGLSRAADSLTRWLGCAVRFAGPDIQTLGAGAMPDPARAGSLVAVRIAIRGQASGWILLLLPLPAVHRFLQAVMGQSAVPRALTAVECSAIQEMGNIVASSFLSELGDRVGRRLIPSVPECYLDGVTEAVDGVLASVRDFGPDVFVVQAALEDGDGRVQGRIFIMPEAGAWEPVCRGAASG